VTYPHHPAFRFRLPLLLAGLVAAIIAGGFHPGYLASRLVNPLWTGGATVAGFLMTWLVLKFHVVTKFRFFSRRFVRGFSLASFYVFASTGLLLLADAVLSGSTRDDILLNFMIALPLAFGAAAGAYNVYEELVPSNTSLERTREG
jgi:hypothetical protein